jgi:WD40 repeat protein
VTLHAGAARSLGFKSTLRAGLIGQAAFTPDGRWIGLVTDYNRGQGVLINLETMAAGEGAAGDADPAGTRIGNLRGLFNLALSPDGRWAAGGTWKGTGVSVWDVTSGRTIADLPVEGSARVAFSPDGRRLVTGAGIEYRSWDVPSWAPRWSLRRNNAGGLPGHLAFSPDGALLVVNDSLTDLKLLESDTGRELASLQAPTPQGVEWLTFSPSGSHLAVACADCTIELWDLDRIRAQLAAMGLGF